jgi:hypothetical protein
LLPHPKADATDSLLLVARSGSGAGVCWFGDDAKVSEAFILGPAPGRDAIVEQLIGASATHGERRTEPR